MKTAIISDIHGNATALKAVLKDIEASHVDLVISIGDNIGYGPEPEEVVTLLRENNIPSIIGNHELAINRPEFLKWFNPAARISLEKTIGLLSASTIGYISKLGYCMVLRECRFVHGFPPGSSTIYLYEATDDKLKDTLTKMIERICFIGHTHMLEAVGFNGDVLSRQILRQGEVQLNPDDKYLINVGSVGQPRDGDNQAKYVIWDSSVYRLTVRYITYDIADTVRKIYQAGLPEQHAWRLM
jgi:predicted phosphodiesterase